MSRLIGSQISEDEIQRLVLGPVIHAPNQDVASVVLGDYLEIRTLIRNATDLLLIPICNKKRIV